MIYLSDNRPHVYQWDTDIELTVAEGCTQVHFANSLYGRSTDVEVVDGKVFIPDKFLQSSRDIFVWGWVGVGGKGKTLVNAKIKVVARNKPADYMFTPEEQTDLKIIEDRLAELEATVDKEYINQLAIDSINNYLATNPIEQVQTDWLENNPEAVKHILNRTHWTDSDGTVHKLDNKYLDLDWLPINRVLKTWLASESKYDFELKGEDYVETTEIPLPVELAEGNNYFVVWDGVNYECDCYNVIGSDGTVWNCLGNSALMRAFETLHPTDDPFLVRFTKLDDETSLLVMETYNTELTHNVGVFKGEKLLNKIPTEFLPVLNDVVMKSSTSGSNKEFRITVDDNGTITATEV